MGMRPIIRMVAALLVLVTVASACGANDASEVRTYLDATYERIANDAVGGARDDTRTYRSDADVATTANEIESAVNPQDRAENDAGTYLQYSSVVVAVQPPASGGGSIVTLDDDEHARRRFPFIVPIFIGGGGRGGFGGGSGGTFRGGGPGFGK